MLAAERNRFMVWSAGAGRWTLAPFCQANANWLLAGVTRFPAIWRTVTFWTTGAPRGKSAGGADTRGRITGLTWYLPDNPCDVRRTIIAAAFARYIWRADNRRARHPVRIFAGAGGAGPVAHVPDVHMNAPLCNSDGFAEVDAGACRTGRGRASEKQDAHCYYRYNPEILFHGPSPWS